MSMHQNIPFYVFGHELYNDLSAFPGEELGYFANSSMIADDPEFPVGELRMRVNELRSTQTDPARGFNFKEIDIIIDFSTT